MAAGNGTWTGAKDRVWTDAANWTGGVPGDTHTATFNGTTGAGLPNSALLEAGVTINFTFSGTAAATISALVNGATIGDVLVDDTAAIVAGANIAGNVSMGGGTLTVANGLTVTGTTAVGGGGILACSGAGTATFTGEVTLQNGSTITVANGTTMAASIVCDGTTGAISNAGTITGNINAVAATITWTGTGSVNIQGAASCTFNPGTTVANSQTFTLGNVGAANTITVGANFGYKSLTVNTDGTVDFGGKDITAVTDDGTLTYTAGTIAAGLANTDVTFNANCTWAWGYTEYLGTLTVATAKTLTVAASKAVYISRLVLPAGSAMTLDDTTPLAIVMAPGVNGWWTVAAGTLSNLSLAAGVAVRPTVDNLQTNQLLDISTAGLAGGAARFLNDGTNKTIKFPNGLKCGSLDIEHADGGTDYASVDMDGGNLVCTGVVFGTTDAPHFALAPGRLYLRSGTHTIAGNVIQATGQSNENHILDFGTSNTTITGNLTLDNINVAFGSAKVTVQGNVVGTDAVTVTNAGAAIYGDGGTQIDALVNTSAVPIYAYKASANPMRHPLGLGEPKTSLDCDEANSTGNTGVVFRNLLNTGLSRRAGRGRNTTSMGGSRRRLTRV